MFAVAAVLFSVVTYATAQIPHLGKCPNVTVVEDLKVESYLGDWFEIKKFFFFIEGSETCIRANYSIKEDGHIKVYNRGVMTDGTVDASVGDAYAPDPKVPAKLSVTFNNSPRVPYWVVDTDYTSYSLVWSCSEIGGFAQADFAWILSRSKTLDADTITKLMNKLGSFGVNTSSFRDTSQENCPY